MKNKMMKKAYLVGMLLLTTFLYFPVFIIAQGSFDGPSGPGPTDDVPDAYHIIWIADGKEIGDHETPFMGSDNVEFSIMTVNLDQLHPDECSVPAILQVREKETGTVIGESEDIFFRLGEDYGWEEVDESGGSLPCASIAKYYRKTLIFEINVTSLACCSSGKKPTKREVDLEFEFMAKLNDTYVSYVNYGDRFMEENPNWVAMDTYDCIYNIFDQICLGHGHEHDGDPNHSHSHTHKDGDKQRDSEDENFIPHEHVPSDDAVVQSATFTESGKLFYACVADKDDPYCSDLDDAPSPDTDAKLASHVGDHHAEEHQTRTSLSDEQPPLKSYPSPFIDQMFLEYFSKSSGSIQLEIKNIGGTTIMTSDRTVDEGFNKMEIDLENQPSGIYLIRLFDGAKWISQKVVKSE